MDVHPSARYLAFEGANLWMDSSLFFLRPLPAASLAAFPGNERSARTLTGAGAHTTALVAPDQLYVISAEHGGVLILSDA